MNFIAPVSEIIRNRKSKRSFSNELPAQSVLDMLNTVLKENSIGPFGNRVDFKLIEKKSAQTEHKVKLGTYGFISGARFFIAGALDASKPFALEDYGYLLEKIILHLTDWGLGTCWLGGTFNRNDFAQILSENPSQVIPAITPVGIPIQNTSIKENIIRWGAKSNSRKNWDELFFEHSFQQNLTPESAQPFETPLEMVRWAPSASNKQPWRIVKNEQGFHFFLEETPGYDKMIKAIKLQRIDMGIAMAHFDLTCRELQLPGQWRDQKPAIESKEKQYITSWIV